MFDRRLLMNRWVVIAGLTAGAIAALLGLGILLQGSPGSPLNAVKDFLGVALRGNYESAYKKFHSDLKARYTLQEFIDEAAKQAALFDSQRRDWSRAERDEGIIVDGRITGRNGEPISARFWLVKEGGDWRIRSFLIQDSGGNKIGRE